MATSPATVTCTSLAGGQGKTTVSLFLGKLLATKSYKVLMVDADSQASLTFYLGHDVERQQPTLLEVLNGGVSPEQAVYTTQHDDIYLIPADSALGIHADPYLMSSGVGALMLKKRLQALHKLLDHPFDFVIIDSPPQRSQLSLTCIAASDELLIPVEASSKGANSLVTTLEVIDSLKTTDTFTGNVLGVIPFRDKWTGFTQSLRSRVSIESIVELAEDIPVLPSVRESEQFKKAIDAGLLIPDKYKELAYPFETIVEILEKKYAR